MQPRSGTFGYLLGVLSCVFPRLRRLNPYIWGKGGGLVLFDFASGAAGAFDASRINLDTKEAIYRAAASGQWQAL